MTNQPVFLFEAASVVPTIHISYRASIQSRNRRTFPDIFVLHSEQRRMRPLFRVLNRTNSQLPLPAALTMWLAFIQKPALRIAMKLVPFRIRRYEAS